MTTRELTDPFLSVDVGNTTVVIGLFDADRPVRLWRLSSFVGRTADEIRLVLDQLLGGHSDTLHDVPSGIASVVPSITEPFTEGCRVLLGRTPVVISHALDLGVPIRYRDPSQVGPDRLANAAAVRAEYRLPAVVVDLGTTTNFDVIGADGAFEGGVIAPGYFSSAEELFRRAARLPRVELTRPAAAVGRTTADAIRSGVVFGTVGQIDGIVTRIVAEVGGDPLVLGTGGLADAVFEESSTIQTVDPALTLKGIRVIALRNPV